VEDPCVVVKISSMFMAMTAGLGVSLIVPKASTLRVPARDCASGSRGQ
jgi:hypothetical protein